MTAEVYLLDTNVVSELMRPEPHTAVLAWIDAEFRHCGIALVNPWESASARR